MSAQSVAYKRKAWIAAVIVLVGTALPWMAVSRSTRTNHSFGNNRMRVSQPFSASCSAWTTTFRLGALPIPLGMTVSIGTLLAALYAGHRGTGDYRGKISLAASIATMMLVLIFALLLTVARGAGGGIGVLISLCGLVWQAIPAAHSTERSEGLVANYYRRGLTCSPEIDPGRLGGRRRSGSTAVQTKPTKIV